MDIVRNRHISLMNSEEVKIVKNQLISLDEEAQLKRDKIQAFKVNTEKLRDHVIQNGTGEPGVREQFLSEMEKACQTKIATINRDLLQIRNIRRPLAHKYEQHLEMSAYENELLKLACQIKPNIGVLALGSETEQLDGSGAKCNCKRTSCLKLYCDCFSNSFYCSPGCSCFGCRNTCEHKFKVVEARDNILQRKPEAFQPKSDHFSSANSDSIHQQKSGCRCRKTKCLKKYCVCFNSGKSCEESCLCVGCENKTTGSGSEGELGSSKDTLDYNLDNHFQLSMDNKQSNKRVRLMPNDE